MESDGKIFIQIASYRDPQLVPTVLDCIKNAKNPDKLIFCIAWQHDASESIDEIINLPNVKIIDIPYWESKGACWARNRIQQEYDNEEYTLQLDSHHRFVENWDDIIIGMYKTLQKKGYKKPLLTGYIPSFDPDNDPAGRSKDPWKMDFDRFIPEGAVFFLPAAIENWQQLDEPVPSRFYSAHFCFTGGQFCKEVPHDPEYYFHGEEISIAVRAYTWGYDLFHPHRIIAWHEYTRKGRTKHWDDHSSQNQNKITDGLDWSHRNDICHKRNRCLFSMDGEKYESVDWGPYGFGDIRTLKDYEKYSGLLFSKRAVQQDTIDRKYPPNANAYANDEEWENSFMQLFKHCIDIGYAQVREKDYDFWVVAFHDNDDNTIYREDANKDEISRMLKDPDGYCKIWRQFPTLSKPKYWVVWPHSESKGWCEKMIGNL